MKDVTWKERSERLKEMGITYSEYLKSEEWKIIKNRSLKKPFYKKCLLCSSDKQINLHHKNYKWIGTKNAMRGLVPLCIKCHDKIHKYSNKKNIKVSDATNIFLKSYYRSLPHVIASTKKARETKQSSSIY